MPRAIGSARSAEENIAPVQAKYVISVVDVKEPEKDPTRKDVIFTVEARNIQQLKAYVMAAADSEEDVSRHPKNSADSRNFGMPGRGGKVTLMCRLTWIAKSFDITNSQIRNKAHGP